MATGLSRDPHTPATTTATASAVGIDRQLVRRLWDEQGRDVFHFAFARLRNREEAADICQATFLRALRWIKHHPDATPQRVNYPAWLRQIARRLIIDHVRRARRETPASTLARQGASTPDWVDPDAPAPGDRATDRESLEALRHCEEALSSEERQLLVARIIDEEEYKTIAARMGATVEALRVRFLRIRRQLKECVQMRLADVHAGRQP